MNQSARKIKAAQKTRVKNTATNSAPVSDIQQSNAQNSIPSPRTENEATAKGTMAPFTGPMAHMLSYVSVVQKKAEIRRGKQPQVGIMNPNPNDKNKRKDTQVGIMFLLFLAS